jgi:hypothetical protein
MRYKDCIIAWEPNAGPMAGVRSRGAAPGEVEVGPHPDGDGWSRRYAMTITGGMFRKCSAMRAAMQCFLEFNTLVIREGLDPAKVHDQFLKIDEYRFHMSRETPGADDWPEWYSELMAEEDAWRLPADKG